jgi:hypothetical protein
MRAIEATTFSGYGGLQQIELAKPQLFILAGISLPSSDMRRRWAWRSRYPDKGSPDYWCEGNSPRDRRA